MPNFKEMSAIKSASKEMSQETPIESFYSRSQRLLKFNFSFEFYGAKLRGDFCSDGVEISTLQIIQDSCQEYIAEALILPHINQSRSANFDRFAQNPKTIGICPGWRIE